MNRGTIILGGLMMLSTSAFAINDAILLRLTNQSNNYADETIIRFIDGATSGFDSSFDAYKLFGNNNTTTPSLFTTSSEGYEIAINAFPSLDLNYSFDLYTWTPVAGEFELDFSILGPFGMGVKIFIEDRSLDSTYEVTENLPVLLDLPVNQDTAARFKVYFTLPAIVHPSPSCSNADNGALQIHFPDTYGYRAFIFDSSNALIESVTPDSVYETLEALNAGTYHVVVERFGLESDSLEVSIDEIEVFDLFAELTDCQSPWNQTGSIDLSFSSDPMGFDFLWNDGTTTEDRTRICAGVYAVTVSDTNLCSRSDSFEILFSPSDPGLNEEPNLDSLSDALPSEVEDENSSSQGDETTGLPTALGSKSNLILYPNPASDQISIRSEVGLDGDRVQIYSINGTLLNESSGLFGVQWTMDTQHLPSGLYFLLHREKAGQFTRYPFTVVH